MNKIIKTNRNNKAQELSRARWLCPKRAQEEFVGFALIIIIVAVILLVFLSFTLRQPKANVQSYEVESFLQTALQYTTDCRNNYESLPLQKLIVACIGEETCADGRETCNALNNTLREMIGEGWGVGEEYPTKAYELRVITENKTILDIEEGNLTRSYKSAVQDFSKSGNSIQIYFKAYN